MSNRFALLLSLLPVLVFLTACGGSGDTVDQTQGSTGESGSSSPTDVPYVVSKFFLPGQFPDKRAYLKGEMAAEFADEPSIGENLPDDARVSFRHLGASDVWAVSITAEGDHGDYYAYLEPLDDRLRLSAIRALAVSPEIAAAGGPGMRLAISADSEIRKFGITHLAELNQIADWLSDHPSASSLEPAAPGEKTVAAAALMRRFGFATAERDPDYAGDVFIVIGGVTDNAAGFLRVPEGGSVPAMDAVNFIYVDRFAPGWYVYKTT